MAQGRMEQWLAGAPGPHGIRLAHACESEMCARQRSRKVCPVAAAASQSGSGALCALRNARMAVVKCSTAARASPARARPGVALPARARAAGRARRRRALRGRGLLPSSLHSRTQGRHGQAGGRRNAGSSSHARLQLPHGRQPGRPR